MSFMGKNDHVSTFLTLTSSATISPAKLWMVLQGCAKDLGLYAKQIFISPHSLLKPRALVLLYKMQHKVLSGANLKDPGHHQKAASSRSSCLLCSILFPPWGDTRFFLLTLAFFLQRNFSFSPPHFGST